MCELTLLGREVVGWTVVDTTRGDGSIPLDRKNDLRGSLTPETRSNNMYTSADINCV